MKMLSIDGEIDRERYKDRSIDSQTEILCIE